MTVPRPEARGYPGNLGLLFAEHADSDRPAIIEDEPGAERGRVPEEGRRCDERKALEFHHRVPYGLGGDHSVGNISLLCPQHNRYVAEQDYGRALVRERIRTRANAKEQPPS